MADSSSRLTFAIAIALVFISAPVSADLGFERADTRPNLYLATECPGARTLGTDYQCVNDCIARGYMYSLCVDKCSWDDSNQPSQPPKQTDYACVNDCTANGYQYSYCVARCSY